MSSVFRNRIGLSFYETHVGYTLVYLLRSKDIIYSLVS